jgi:hypothetical protein
MNEAARLECDKIDAIIHDPAKRNKTPCEYCGQPIGEKGILGFCEGNHIDKNGEQWNKSIWLCTECRLIIYDKKEESDGVIWFTMKSGSHWYCSEHRKL